MTPRQSLVAFVLIGFAAGASGNTPFTIVALPDTQNYSNNASNALLFNQQTQWIADEIQTAGNPRNIQFVTHLGDVVSNGNDLVQWTRADTAMDTLDGVVKYSALPGNHDYNSTSNKSTGTVNYVNNFGPSRYASYSWYGGADPSGNNSYQLFTAGGYDFLHLALEWQPTVNIPIRDPSPVEWAQSILDAHPNTPVILSTHEHIDDDPAGRSATGEQLWQDLIRYNDQIFMVLNGHYHSVGGTNDGEYHQISFNEANRPVFEVLQDFQDYPNGGDGWLRLINFDIPNDKIEFETYSPVLDQFQTETVAQVGQFASQFEFNIDFADRLTPVFIPDPPVPSPPDLIFQEGLNGYVGTQDKEIRSSGGDTTNGQATFISVDGDDGSPGNQPNQGLIRFDNFFGAAAGQLPVDADLAQAKLVLEVFNPGSGFTVHEMLVDWDENDTWASLGAGIQANGTEAVATPVASLGANNDSSNVVEGTLEIDVTSTVQAYLDGTLTNYGWALIPYVNGINGLDFFSSEAAGMSVRPMLEIFLVPLPGDANGDGSVDILDLDILGMNFGKIGGSAYSDGDFNGDGNVDLLDLDILGANYGAMASTAVPEPSALLLALTGLVLLKRTQRTS